MSLDASSRIKVTCACGKKFLVQDKYSGKRGRCPSCKEPFDVPTRDENSGAKSPAEASAVNPQTASYFDQLKADYHDTYSDVSLKEPGKMSSPSWWRNPKLVVVTVLCLVAVLLAAVFQAQLNGPGFLAFYLGVALACCAGIAVGRFTGCPASSFVVIVIAYEAIGLIRYNHGTSLGMNQFGTMWLMMIFGPIAIPVIAFIDQLGDSSGSGSGWGFSSCSSGCGSSCGGGCGGGGCGGCGG